mgnify:FL=1
MFVMLLIYEHIQEANVRITVHIPDNIENELKINAANANKSVSSLVAEAITYYIRHKQRLELGNKMLDLAGKVKISSDAQKELESGRIDDRT